MFTYKVRRDKAVELLARVGKTPADLKAAGEVQLAPGLKITFTGRCTYTCVDQHSTGGENLALCVEPEDRQLIPALAPDSDGTHNQRQIYQAAQDLEALKMQRVREALGLVAA